MQKIKQGDTVKILSGKEKGKTGEVVKVLPKSAKVVVKGVNIVTKHRKQSAKDKGGLIKVEAPLYLSKVMYIDSGSGKPSRVKFQKDAKGKKIRIALKAKKVTTKKKITN
jgi:large subunit ribosomal protein L24